MKKILILLAACIVLAACSPKETAIKELPLDKAKGGLSDYITGIETREEEKGTGVNLYQKEENRRYLYLNEDFLNEGKNFGEVTVETDDDSIRIYTSEVEGEPSANKLYIIELDDRQYEYMRVYKDGEETHFANIGV